MLTLQLIYRLLEISQAFHSMVDRTSHWLQTTFRNQGHPRMCTSQTLERDLRFLSRTLEVMVPSVTTQAQVLLPILVLAPQKLEHIFREGQELQSRLDQLP